MTAVEQVQAKLEAIGKFATESNEVISTLVTEKALVERAVTSMQEKSKALTTEIDKLKCDKLELERRCDKLSNSCEGYKRSNELYKKKTAQQKLDISLRAKKGEEKDAKIKELESNYDKLAKEDEKGRKRNVALQDKVLNLQDKVHSLENQIRRLKQVANNAVSVSASPNDISEDDQMLRNALEKTIVVGENGFDKVAGMKEVKNAINNTIILPLRQPAFFLTRQLLDKVLLYGPPGTGKSYIAKCVAKETGCTLFSIKASDIGSKWKGDSEKFIKNLFVMASEKADEAGESGRSIIFIDEIDSICSRRDGRMDDSADRKVLNEFLTHTGGTLKNVVVLAATNLPWDLDTAILSRFKKKIFVPLPDKEARLNMLKIHIGDTPHTLSKENFEALANKTDGASARDIEALVSEALLVQVQQGVGYYKREGDMYIPAPHGDCLHVNFNNGICTGCGVTKISVKDIPMNKLKARDVDMRDFETKLESKYNAVSPPDLENFLRFKREGSTF